MRRILVLIVCNVGNCEGNAGGYHISKAKDMQKLKWIILFSMLHPLVATAQVDTCPADRAILLAEAFIRTNGYTLEPADTSDLQPEFIYDDGLSKMKIARNRLNSLQRRASYISEHQKEWHIGFLYTPEAINKYRKKYKHINSEGRAVIVAKDFSEIRMAHKAPLFDKWKRIN